MLAFNRPAQNAKRALPNGNALNSEVVTIYQFGSWSSTPLT